GGKGLFALDVTDPANIKLLWEIGVDQEPDLGYSFPKPTVARLHNGKWAVVTGNGYSSLNDKAALLIIDLETGAITRKLEVTGRTGVPNGLSSPRLADNNSDGVADYAYAGDLQGNLWRFDLIAGKVNQDDPFSRANDGPA
ncbi:pilus assembly protein PilY, partial [Pseudomonas aeruginosa]